MLTQGLLALHPGLVGLQGHCSHPRAYTPHHCGRRGRPLLCVTEPMVDGHGQVGNYNPSGCECYVGNQRFCRGCRTRRGVVEVGLDHYSSGASVWYWHYAWLWYLQCYVTHQGEIQELERSHVLVKPGSYCVIQNHIFVLQREVSLDVATGARG